MSYGTSSKGKEVMIVNDREIFHEKYSGKSLINNIFKIGWNCKNKHNCYGTLVYLFMLFSCWSSNSKMGITSWITSVLQ